jgi:uncharacterized protein (DUF983 family)
MSKEKDDAVFWGVIGVIILVAALTWLGTEVGLWVLEFPFWGTMAVWVGIAIVVSSIRKLRNPEEAITKSEPWC